MTAHDQSTNAACASKTPPNSLGASGRVTASRADLGPDGGVEGSFDVLLESGDRLKGTFAAALCGSRDAGPEAGCR